MRGIYKSIIMILLAITIFAGCTGGNANDVIEIDNYSTYQIKTKLAPDTLTWESSDPTCATVDDMGTVKALKRGEVSIYCTSSDGIYFKEYKFKINPFIYKPNPVTLILKDFDKITIAEDDLTIYDFLYKAYGKRLYKPVKGKVFMGYYNDVNYDNETDYDMKVDSDLTIYPHYEEDETDCSLTFPIDKVYFKDDEVVLNDAITVFTQDFGATPKYKDVSYENYTFVKVEFMPKENKSIITKIITSSQEDERIPYNGYIISIPNTKSNIIKEIKVGDSVDLNDYSVIRAGTAYINKTKSEVAKKVDIKYPKARYVSVFDATAGNFVYEYNPVNLNRPASTTKIITAITALKHADLDAEITVEDELAITYEGPDPSVAGLIKGQKWTLRSLLYALMLPSGNDAAYTIAKGVAKMQPGQEGKSTRELLLYFNELMNEVCLDVGAENSHFMVPDGNSYYNADGSYEDRFYKHYVCARDMTRFANLGFNCPALAIVVGSPSVAINENGIVKNYANTNRLINPDHPDYYPFAVGMKTGYTGAAGSCLVAGAFKDGRFIIASVMFDESGNRNANVRKILKKVFAN